MSRSLGSRERLGQRQRVTPQKTCCHGNETELLGLQVVPTPKPCPWTNFTVNTKEYPIFGFRSTASSCSLPSIGTRQPPRKKLEEVSGFVVVTKQNYFKKILKDQRQQQFRAHCAIEQKGTDRYSQRTKGDIHQVIRCGESTRNVFDNQEAKEDELREQFENKTKQKTSKLSDMRMNTRQDNTSGRIGTFSEDGIQSRDECVETDKECARIRSNQSGDAASGRYSDEGEHSRVTHNKSQETPNTGHRNITEDRSRENLSQKEVKEMQTVAERCVKEVFPSIKNSQVSSVRSNSSSNDHTTQIDMCDLKRTADLKRMEKIEAIEGWMKLYESESANEREKEICNKINNNEEKEVLIHNASLCRQDAQKAASHSALSQGTSKSMGTPKSQTSAAFLPKYVDVIGAKQRESLTQRTTHCSGSHPRNEGENILANIKPSQQDLESFKYILSETLEEREFNQQNVRTGGKERSVSNTYAKIHEAGVQPVNIERAEEGFFGLITNMNTGNDFLENVPLTPLSTLQNMSYSSRIKNSNESGVVVEPICHVVRLAEQQNEQFFARSQFKRASTREGNGVTLEQIEAMIEPNIEEPSVNEQKVKECKPINTVAKTEPNRSSYQSLIPGIMQVKLGIDNQSKILDKLDEMMKHSGIVDRNVCTTRPIKAASVQCSEEVTEENTACAVGKAEVTSRGHLSFPSDSVNSKIKSDRENSKISHNNEAQHRSPIIGSFSDVSAFKQMSGGRSHDLLQCPCLHKLHVCGCRTTNCCPVGEYRTSIIKYLSI